MTTVEAPAPARRRHARSAAVALLALSVLILPLVVRDAPDRLVSAAPADGARLASPPETAELTFSSPLDPARSHMRVGTAGGALVPAGAFTARDRTATLPVTVAGTGEYVVAYHVAFESGREVSGLVRFTVGAGGTDLPAAGGEPAAGGHGHEGSGPGMLLFIGADLVALLVAGLLLVRRRRPAGERR